MNDVELADIDIDIWNPNEFDIGMVSILGWKPPPDMPWHVYDVFMGQMSQLDYSMNWIIGDLIAYGERKWGETYAQAMDVFNIPYQRAADLKWVAEAVPHWVRRGPPLFWTHHKYVAKFPPDVQDKLLREAERNSWTTAELRGAINGKLVPDIEWRERQARSRRRLLTELIIMYEEGVGQNDVYRWTQDLSGDERKAVIELRDMSYGLASFCDEIVGRLNGTGRRESVAEIAVAYQAGD